MLDLNKIPKPYVLVLIGPPLSGKSTFIKTLDTDATIISKDQILLDLHGSDNYHDAYHNVDDKLARSTLDAKFKLAASNKENVIADMTNMTTKRRKHTLSYFTRDYYKVAVIFPVLDWEEYVRRNNKRREDENKYIPEEVIKEIISKYKPIDETEGFDLITSP